MEKDKDKKPAVKRNISLPAEVFEKLEESKKENYTGSLSAEITRRLVMTFKQEGRI